MDEQNSIQEVNFYCFAITLSDIIIKCQMSNRELTLYMSSMKLVNPLHSLYWSIHTKDESKRGTAFAFIFGVN